MKKNRTYDTMTRNMTKGLVLGLMTGWIIVVFGAMPGAIAHAVTATSTGGGGDSIYVVRYLPDIIKGAQGPADMVFFLYRYLMGLVGVVAVGVIMYGGVLRTMSADPSKIKASNEYIKNALKGIVLLFGAQVIFNTINPNIIDIARIQKALQPDERIVPNKFVETLISLTEGTGTSTTAVGTGAYAGRPLADIPVAEIRATLGAIGGITMLDECTPGGSTSGCISFSGVKQKTLDAMISMAKAGIPVAVWSVTEGSHTASDRSHANGYKWDMAGIAVRYFENNPQFERIATRSDSTDTFRDRTTGAECSFETKPSARGNRHWDCGVK